MLTHRIGRRVVAVALGVTTGLGAVTLDATATAAGEPVCVDVGPVTYVPAPGARTITVPACPAPTPAASATQERATGGTNQPKRKGLYRPPGERWGGRADIPGTTPEPRQTRRGLYRPPSQRWGGQ